MTPSFIIQLGIDHQDDKLFWCDPHLWDTRDSEPDTVQRPTEIAAFRSLYRQARLIRKRGMYINLSPLHIQALRLEHEAMSTPPTPNNIHKWVSERMAGVTQLQVKALLQECSLAILLRDVLNLQPIVIDWDEPVIYTKRRAA